MNEITKKEIVIDTSNMYVQTLLKIFNEFILEEAAGHSFTEDRLKTKITTARNLFREEKNKPCRARQICIAYIRGDKIFRIQYYIFTT